MGKPYEENVITSTASLKVPDVSYGQHTLDQLRGIPLRILQVDGRTGQHLTNRDILERSVKLAAALEDRGVKVGDTVAISAENHLNWFIVVCAVLYRGAIIAPMNPAYSEGEAVHCLKITKPKLIFVSRLSENLISESIKKLPWRMEILQLDDTPLSSRVTTLKSIFNESRVWPDPFIYEAVKIERPDKQEAAVLYSSGTTGMPKGVMLSHRNLLLQGFALRAPDALNLRDTDVILVMPPFFHGYGFSFMMTIFQVGAMAITMTSFDPELYFHIIEKYRVTILPVAPPIMNLIAKLPMISRYDYSSLKEIVCGAAPLVPEIRQNALKRLGVSVFRHAYGMTELSMIISMTDRSMKKPESVGYPVPGVSCKVIDPRTSKSLGPRETGEMCFKGGHVMLGYKDNPEATKETIDRDGWLHTGDLGYYDEDGDLFIVDRLKELIKYKAFQVSPSAIEGLLLSHPDITDAAVVGKPDEDAGELPMAFVVRRPSSKITAEEICNFVNEQVSPQSKIRAGVRFVNSIPKNPGGKILRKELRNLVCKL